MATETDLMVHKQIDHPQQPLMICSNFLKKQLPFEQNSSKAAVVARQT